MANHKSAMKRMLQNEKRRLRNRRIRSNMRTLVKRVFVALEEQDAASAQTALPPAVNALQRAAVKGVIHRNTASRRISRMTRAVGALSPS